MSKAVPSISGTLGQTGTAGLCGAVRLQLHAGHETGKQKSL